MGSHECPKVLPCLATGREGRGTWDQVTFVLGCFLGIILLLFYLFGVLGGSVLVFVLFVLFCGGFT